MDDFVELAEAARVAGWAVGSIQLPALRIRAHDLGWEQVATRRGDSPVSVLRPTAAEEAHPRSLSAIHGLGEQPMHTDGAHLREPPDYLVFHADRPNRPTLLWSEASKLGAHAAGHRRQGPLPRSSRRPVRS
jgi:hypothetical protein